MTQSKRLIDLVHISRYSYKMVINQVVKHNDATDPLSAIFAAFADPTRRSILARLTNKPASVNEIAQPYDMSLPAVSKHLKILEQAGLITKSRIAQKRICHLEAAKFKEATEWLDNYRSFWEANLDSLDQYLQEIKLNQ